MEEITLSVWTITYNHEKYLRQCLESIVSQKTSFRFELVIGEDCSTDGTRAILKEFEANYPDIVKPIYHHSNVGMLRNANEFCFPQLKGKYVACLEGDDYWTDPHKLQKQVDFLEQHQEYSACFTNTMYVDSKGHTIGHSERVPAGVQTITYQDLIQRLFIHTPSIVFRKALITPEFLEQTKGFKASDFPLFLKLSLAGPIHFIPENMTAYRMNVGVSSQWDKHDGFLNKVKIVNKFAVENELSFQQKLATKISLAWFHLKLARNMALDKKPGAFMHYILFLYYSMFKLFFKGRIIEQVSLADYIRPFKYFFLTPRPKHHPNEL